MSNPGPKIQKGKDAYRENPGPAKKRSKDAYRENPESAKQRSKDTYNENPGPKRTYEREKARAKKKDSSANDKMYNESIKYGPLFIYVCCHRGLFENSVKPFTETLKNKIKKTLLDASCDFKEEIRFNGEHYI